MTDKVAVPMTARNATLDDLATLLKDQHARKLDIVAPATSIHAEGGRLVIAGAEPVIDTDGVTPADGVYAPTEICDAGIADKLGIPVGYLRRMRESAPELYDGNVNGWLHGLMSGGRHAAEHDYPGRAADARSFLVRCFPTGAGGACTPGLPVRAGAGALSGTPARVSVTGQPRQAANAGKPGPLGEPPDSSPPMEENPRPGTGGPGGAPTITPGAGFVGGAASHALRALPHPTDDTVPAYADEVIAALDLQPAVEVTHWPRLVQPGPQPDPALRLHPGSLACDACVAELPEQFATFPTVCPHRTSAHEQRLDELGGT